MGLQLPHRGQHSPSGTVALAQGIRGQEILRHTVTEFWREEQRRFAELIGCLTDRWCPSKSCNLQ